MSQFEQQWQRRFEKFATRHQDDHQVSGWSLTGLRRRVATFERLLDGGLLPEHSRVLDLGCGAGTYVRLLEKRGHVGVGLDYSVASLGRAVAADPGIGRRYAAGGACELPFGDAVFDGVICIGVLQALERIPAAIAEISRTLRPGGTLLIETLNPRSPVAAARRLRSLVGRQPNRLNYVGAGVVEAIMRSAGITPRERLGILLAPRSVPRLASALARPSIVWLLNAVPGMRSIAPHAFWIVGTKRS